MKSQVKLFFFQPRTVRIGMCLPSTCSLDDVEKMALHAEPTIPHRQINILDVRSPTQNPYEYWNDKTFIILA